MWSYILYLSKKNLLECVSVEVSRFEQDVRMSSADLE